MMKPNFQPTTRHFWEADKVAALIRLRGHYSHYFTGDENTSRHGWMVIQRELCAPGPLAIIIETWNQIVLEYQDLKRFNESRSNENCDKSKAQSKINDEYLLTGSTDHMREAFYDLQKEGQMVDVTIAAGGKLFKAHKLVLSACSPYFEMMFLQDPSPHPTIFMTDVDSSQMDALIKFMYTGKVHVNHENLAKFVKAAESMQIKVFGIENSPPETDELKVDLARAIGFTEPIRPKLSSYDILNYDSRCSMSNNIAYNNLNSMNCGNSANEKLPSNFAVHKTNSYSIIPDSHKFVSKRKMMSNEHEMEDNGKQLRY